MQWIRREEERVFIIGGAVFLSKKVVLIFISPIFKRCQGPYFTMLIAGDVRIDVLFRVS